MWYRHGLLSNLAVGLLLLEILAGCTYVATKDLLSPIDTGAHQTDGVEGPGPSFSAPVAVRPRR